ncbi:TetR/AcrR family transcriptional regulator [Phycicoccus mangrovi]|uniref:TetR/AcrR family transcriptional regulator n=1 Tax=Phycicoccus mangrovi TaxID=2840470 RepID=UPI001C003291|nr:TetR/AcrR family transcriptional regulator [Phycicoccus mangrovi]
MDRRQAIAVAAMELAASGGGHAVTHRKVDRHLGWPDGTTSNYARTRRELIRLVIEHVASIANYRPVGATPPTTVSMAVPQLVAAFEATVTRGIDTRARLALTVDSLSDPELHELLTTQSPVRAKLVEEGITLLDHLGVTRPASRAVDFITLMNGLLYDRLVGNGSRGRPADAEDVIRAWLIGVGARQ